MTLSKASQRPVGQQTTSMLHVAARMTDCCHLIKYKGRGNIGLASAKAVRLLRAQYNDNEVVKIHVLEKVS